VIWEKKGFKHVLNPSKSPPTCRQSLGDGTTNQSFNVATTPDLSFTFVYFIFATSGSCKHFPFASPAHSVLCLENQ
jgi:hypothetical protein